MNRRHKPARSIRAECEAWNGACPAIPGGYLFICYSIVVPRERTVPDFVLPEVALRLGDRMKLSFALFFAFMTLTSLAASADDFAPIALNSIAAVPATIIGARVMDAHGTNVGAVLRIETDTMGKPLKADITLTGGRLIVLEASALGYDQKANVLVTAQDQGQLLQTPSAAPR
jgi:hypothetical protein